MGLSPNTISAFGDSPIITKKTKRPSLFFKQKTASKSNLGMRGEGGGTPALVGHTSGLF